MRQNRLEHQHSPQMCWIITEKRPDLASTANQSVIWVVQETRHLYSVETEQSRTLKLTSDVLVNNFSK